jgi:hypothetical protein
MSNGESLTTLAWAYKNGLFLAASAVFDSNATYVCMGLPSNVSNEIVSIGAVRTVQDPATLSTNRAREEVLTCEVTITVFQGGMDDSQLTVDERAFELLSMLEKNVHYVVDGIDGTTLGGIVRECFLTAIDQDSYRVGGSDQTAAGRECLLIATFQGKGRVQWQS